MRKLKFSLGLLLIFVIGSMTTSCSKDDEPANNSIFGVWSEIGDPEDDFPMLITPDCIVMEDTGSGASVLIPYVNASYETLENRFAPDDEFFVYRYDKKNDVYILYSGTEKASDGTILFDTEYPLLMRATTSNNILECQLQWLELNEAKYVTREELLSKDKYRTVPSNVNLHFEEVRTYSKVK